MCPAWWSTTIAELAVTSELFPYRILGGYGGLGGELLNVKLAFLGGVQALELSFHELHELLLGDFALFVGVHEQEQVFDVILAEGELVLRLGDGVFLGGGGHYGNKDQQNRGYQNGCEFSSGRHVWTPLAGDVGRNYTHPGKRTFPQKTDVNNANY
jgi:hypothetical protein